MAEKLGCVSAMPASCTQFATTCDCRHCHALDNRCFCFLPHTCQRCVHRHRTVCLTQTLTEIHTTPARLSDSFAKVFASWADGQDDKPRSTQHRIEDAQDDKTIPQATSSAPCIITSYVHTSYSRLLCLINPIAVLVLFGHSPIYTRSKTVTVVGRSTTDNFSEAAKNAVAIPPFLYFRAITPYCME